MHPHGQIQQPRPNRGGGALRAVRRLPVRLWGPPIAVGPEMLLLLSAPPEMLLSASPGILTPTGPPHTIVKNMYCPMANPVAGLALDLVAVHLC